MNYNFLFIYPLSFSVSNPLMATVKRRIQFLSFALIMSASLFSLGFILKRLVLNGRLSTFYSLSNIR